MMEEKNASGSSAALKLNQTRNTHRLAPVDSRAAVELLAPSPRAPSSEGDVSHVGRLIYAVVADGGIK